MYAEQPPIWCKSFKTCFVHRKNCGLHQISAAPNGAVLSSLASSVMTPVVLMLILKTNFSLNLLNTKLLFVDSPNVESALMEITAGAGFKRSVVPSFVSLVFVEPAFLNKLVICICFCCMRICMLHRFLHPHEVTAPAYRHHDKLRVPRLSNPSVEEESGVQAAEEEAATLPTPETEPTQEEICQTAAPPTTPAAAAPATPSCPETPRVVNRTRPLLCSPCVVAGETPCAEETEEEYEGSCASTTSPGRKARKATTLVPNTLSRDSTRDELHGSVERIMTAAGTLGLADDPN